MVRSIIKRISKGILIFSMLMLTLTGIAWLLVHCPPLCVMAVGGGVVLMGWVMGE